MKPTSEIVIYQSEDARVEVLLSSDTVWLTQEQMTALFGRERSVVTKHLRNVFAESELARDAVCAKIAHTAADGKTYPPDLQDAAVQTVLQQAEALSSTWSVLRPGSGGDNG